MCGLIKRVRKGRKGRKAGPFKSVVGRVAEFGLLRSPGERVDPCGLGGSNPLPSAIF